MNTKRFKKHEKSQGTLRRGSIVSILLVALICIFFSSCSNNSNETSNLEKSTPQRIVSLAPNITEIVYALSAEDQLVGKTTYCNYPETIASVTEIGDTYTYNIEQIVGLKPDIVLAGGMSNLEGVQLISNQGIQVGIINKQANIQSTYETIQEIGDYINRSNEAEQLVNQMQSDIKEIEKKLKDEKEVEVYYVVGFGEYGDYTATGDTFIHELIKVAKGKNIAENEIGWKYSLEKLMEEDPDVIIVPTTLGDNNKTAVEVFSTTVGYKDLTAVKKGNVFAINSDLLDRQGPRISEGINELAKILHPKIYENK